MIMQKIHPTHKNLFHLDSYRELDLQAPITALLPQVYEHTLARQLPGFRALKTCSVSNFKPLRHCHLTLEQKRGLCRFLQATLCSVGKHGIGASRLKVICVKRPGYYSLRVIDDGTNTMSWAKSITSSQGIHQASILSQHLQGKFRRAEICPQGTLYELTWPAPIQRHRWFW